MIQLRSLSRWKAAAIHGGLSLSIAAAIAGLVFLLWYPPNLVRVTGGLALFAILMSVDVTLGPLMTLIVFDPAKKALKFDLAVIAALQLGALCYGLYVVSEARPAYVVFAVDRFIVVTAAEIPERELAKVTDSRYRQVPWFGPRYVAAQRPADESERGRVLFASIMGGVDLEHFPQHYVPYETQARQVAQKARPIELLLTRNPSAAQLVQEFLARKHVLAAHAVFLPIKSRKNEECIVLRRESGEVVGTLPVNPWE